MVHDANAALRQTVGKPALDNFSYDFVSNEIVYVVEGTHRNNPCGPHSLASKHYLSGDMWFKIFLDLNSNGHSGKFLATINRASMLADQPCDLRVANPNHQEMKTRMLEEIVKPAKKPQRM